MQKEIDFYALGERYQKECYEQITKIANSIEEKYGRSARKDFESGFESHHYSFSTELDKATEYGININEVVDRETSNFDIKKGRM